MVDNVAASASRRSLPYSTLIRVGLVLIYLIALGVSAFVVFQRVREQVSELTFCPISPSISLKRATVQMSNALRARPFRSGPPPIALPCSSLASTSGCRKRMTFGERTR